eukprot:TRINITY_DN6361_c0_g1_i1.p1 TRINITY_DN6361_c0_g1~~TRINITY_DN6361_c0_g1_i1.p1  ORF type:complete len:343 (+),score=97.37 TRINITY_DN6361_c0_g1_i1:103-1131(+)
MASNPFAGTSKTKSTTSSSSSNPFGSAPSSKSSSRKASTADANPFGAPPSQQKSAGKSNPNAKARKASAQGANGQGTPGRKASKPKQKPIEETLNIPQDHMARVDENALSTLKSTDQIRVKGSELAFDGDDDTPAAGQPTDRRSTVAARSPAASAQAVAGRDDPGSAGVYASTLRRTFTLSNKSQLEVMKMVKNKQLTVEQALALAAEKEEQETSPALSNEAQLELLMSVKGGQMTQEEALAQAKQRSKQEAEAMAAKEHEASLAEFEDTMSQLFGGSSTLERFDSEDSLQDAMETANQLFQDSSVLDEYCAPVRPLAELELHKEAEAEGDEDGDGRTTMSF